MRRFLLASAALFLFAVPAWAHEAYVLTPEQFQAGMQTESFHALSALQNPDNLRIFVEIAFAVATVFVCHLIIRCMTPVRSATERAIARLAPFGPVAVRAAIAISLFASAATNSLFGPELSLSLIPFAPVVRMLLFAISVLVAIGCATELAAAVGLVIVGLGFYAYHAYLFTYLNYVGELIVLALFGLRHWSVDRKLFGLSNRFPRLKPYEQDIVRMFYGAALMYAAITVKFLHPALTVTVVNQYNLTQFHWLFPSDPLLVTFGAALAELMVGLFIFIGFELRLTVLVSLFYITLSLLFFHEAVWPHLLLYGISVSLLVTKQRLSVDNLLIPTLIKSPSSPAQT